MGIPSLFRWLKEKYPLIINNVNDIKTDCLHIDFNALLHISTHPEDGGNLTKKEMFSLIAYNLDRLVETLKPTRMLHIATDGVAPRAKLNQQRARRFCTAQEAREKGGNEIEESKHFDINSLTPGTIFMSEIRKYIQDLIKYKQSTNTQYKKLEIIYSDDSVPGEGEHKILNNIRKSESHIRHSIYSPDADLIFLGLTLHKHDIHIIREDLDFINTFKKETCSKCGKNGHKDDQCCKLRLEKVLSVSIKRLRSYLKNEFDVVGRQYNLNYMINDLVLICFIAGNDFLPILPILDVRFQAVEYLSKAMLAIFNGEHLTTANGINFNRLQCFFTYLAKTEDELYLRKIKSLDEIRNKIFNSKTFERIDLSTAGGKNEYYAKKLYVFNDEQKGELCYSYIRGMAWIYDYYQGKSNNWDYFFPQHYAPFPSDLCKIRIKNMQFRESKPLCGFKQLLLVLPPDSKDLVPNCFKSIFDDEKLYPRKVRIDRFEKLWDWQSVVRIPLISVTKVINFFDENQRFLTEEEVIRNKEGNNILFLNTQNIKSLDLNKKEIQVFHSTLFPYRIFLKEFNSEGKLNGKNFVNKSTAWFVCDKKTENSNLTKRKRDEL